MSKNLSLVFGAIVSVIIAQLTGVIGSFFTFSSIQTWYNFLEKPAFSPPGWLFAPVWILLYTLMGIAAFLIWQKRGEEAKAALSIYAIHLISNALWSIIFFGLRNPGLAFLEIVVLWILIFVITVKFFKIEKIAGLLFVPYLFWVTFAAILNFVVWRLN
ncbi:MAG: TspO/MBR family protein [bacterium]|nr:TspO/MBR family protein [bacterium]